jgi:hypothetical protein
MNNDKILLGQTKYIPLPKGGTLEVQVTQSFLDRVRYQFNIPNTSQVSDDHIRMFIWGALNCAIEKATQYLKNHAIE